MTKKEFKDASLGTYGFMEDFHGKKFHEVGKKKFAIFFLNL